MNKFTKNLNFYIIKYLLKINKFLGKNRLFQESGFCEFSTIKDNLNCKRLSIQLYQHNDKSYDKEELFKILPLLLDNGIEIELIDFDRILENEDIRTLQQISPKIKVNFRYMIDSFWSGNNVETTYDMECYSKILDKIEYLTKVTKTNFSQEEKQVMFIINQLSEYINYTNNKSNDNKQFTQQSSLKGALLDRDTVCIGYAMAFERCMSNLGFENKIVLGRDKEDPKVKLWSANHAWNLVKIKG